MRTVGKALFCLGSVAWLVYCQEPDEEEEGFDDPEAAELEDDIEQDPLSTQQIRGVHGLIDADKDGKVSIAETLAFSQQMRKAIASKDIGSMLAEMDKDQDGKLSLDELLKDMDETHQDPEEGHVDIENQKAAEKEKFKVADTNSDGFLDASELPSLFYPETHDGVLSLSTKTSMSRKDKDGDGKLSMKEFWEGDLVEGAEPEDMEITDEERDDFENMDKDKNGFLDLEELKAWESGRYVTEEAMKKMFEIADKDRDGHVTADELDMAREAITGTDAQYHLMEWAEHHEL